MGRRAVPDKAERWKKFCDTIAEGKTIVEACKASGTAWGSLQRWITLGDEADQYAAEYARARSLAAHRHASRILDIIDGATPETAHVARLQVDALKWLSAVQNKGAYGDKLTVDGTVKHTVTGVILLPAEDPPTLPQGSEVLPRSAPLAELGAGEAVAEQGEADAVGRE